MCIYRDCSVETCNPCSTVAAWLTTQVGNMVLLPCTVCNYCPNLFIYFLGIRGDVNVIVKIDLFSDFNKFRQSSCGVQFYCSKLYHVSRLSIFYFYIQETCQIGNKDTKKKCFMKTQVYNVRSSYPFCLVGYVSHIGWASPFFI